MKKLKVAIVGYGGMGAWHGEKLKTMPEVEVVGTYDILAERQEAAKKAGFTPYESFEAVLADEELEVVTIATPNDLHKPLAVQLMAAGKNVISEKPVTLCSADLEEMIAASEKYGKMFTVHQNRRWDEDFLVAKKILEDNTLSNAFGIESRVHGSRGIPGDWRNKKQYGGGMVLDWGVHLLDQIVMIKEDKKITSVYAELSNVTNEEVDDGFRTVLTFEDGFRALIEVGTSNFINLPRWYLTGENGSAIIQNWDIDGKITMVSDWEKRDAVPVNTAAGLTKTMAPRTSETIKEYSLPRIESDVRDFYRNVKAVVHDGAPQLITHNQLRRVMKLMETLFEAAEKNQIIHTEI